MGYRYNIAGSIKLDMDKNLKAGEHLIELGMEVHGFGDRVVFERVDTKFLMEGPVMEFLNDLGTANYQIQITGEDGDIRRFGDLDPILCDKDGIWYG